MLKVECLTNMNDRAELLKDSIRQLYSREGRSRSYISRLLGIDRQTVSRKVREWELPEPEPMRHITPSTQKFINRNRQLIKARLDADVSVSEIARELGCDRGLLNRAVLKCDPVLAQAHGDYIRRLHDGAREKAEQARRASRLRYDEPELEGETWKPILGYGGYEVSSCGRIRRWTAKQTAWYTLTPTVNPTNGREYVKLAGDGGKTRNLQVARLVAHSFVDGYDAEHCTVNHGDGNVRNNRADNLSWTSQAENNRHAYQVLNRTRVGPEMRRFRFNRLIYQGRYEFKTVAALARFLGLSETQTRRYLEEPEKHGIIIQTDSKQPL